MEKGASLERPFSCLDSVASNFICVILVFFIFICDMDLPFFRSAFLVHPMALGACSNSAVFFQLYLSVWEVVNFLLRLFFP